MIDSLSIDQTNQVLKDVVGLDGTCSLFISNTSILQYFSPTLFGELINLLILFLFDHLKN